MGRSKRMSVQKRLREKKKAEAAERKRQERGRGETSEAGRGGTVADREELEGYGVITGPTEESSES